MCPSLTSFKDEISRRMFAFDLNDEANEEIHLNIHEDDGRFHSRSTLLSFYLKILT